MTELLVDPAAADPAAVDPAAVETAEAVDPSLFTVRLTNFTGPFDLLLQLITQHRLDVTEVALHTVTDDFIAHTRALGSAVGLEQTTAFLVVAATLLDLKAARLLPAAEVDSEEDLQLLEARDLLFARLLQHRAYQQVATLLAELEAGALRSYPRSVSPEERFAGLLPEVLLGVDAHRLAEIAAAALAPAPPAPTVGTGHLHVNEVSVREHADLLLGRLRAAGAGTWVDFTALVADCAQTLEVVARFLGLLELHRDDVVVFSQDEALGLLRTSWTGGEPANRVGEDW